MWLQEEKELGSRQSGCRKYSGPPTLCRRNFTWFVKIMSDGFFPLSECFYSRETDRSENWRIFNWLESIILLDWTDWSGQGDSFSFHEEIASSTISSRPFLIWNAGSGTDQSCGDQVIADFIKEDPEILACAPDATAGDISTFKSLIQEAYWRYLLFSTQQIQDEDRWRIPQVHWAWQHRCPRSSQWSWRYQYPSYLVVLKASNEVELCWLSSLSLTGRPIMKALAQPQVVNFSAIVLFCGFVNGKKGLLTIAAIEQETRRWYWSQPWFDSWSRRARWFPLGRLDWVRHSCIVRKAEGGEKDQCMVYPVLLCFCF